MDDLHIKFNIAWGKKIWENWITCTLAHSLSLSRYRDENKNEYSIYVGVSNPSTVNANTPNFHGKNSSRKRTVQIYWIRNFKCPIPTERVFHSSSPHPNIGIYTFLIFSCAINAPLYCAQYPQRITLLFWSVTKPQKNNGRKGKTNCKIGVARRTNRDGHVHRMNPLSALFLPYLNVENIN